MSFIKVRVKPSSKKDEVIRMGEDSFLVSVRSEPRLGEANESVISLLSSFLNIPAHKFKIVKGGKSPSKIILVREEKIIND